ncbi:DEP domain-containing protein 1A-like [Tropilaelaps mercedesae]|uniref:DEP domain-containing protein 1A-like n=1 Tax=Tropilaelaps mercedesae TaxID=418985 RepID=A0A1V9X3K8_9ACAR|nr:DEP domain-containing protein 1A-like [Tropilaelaps mercedesae]
MNECNTEDRSKVEQFRATRTWSTIVLAVRDELPVGRHRKGFRRYENCFAGDDAVSWIVDYLEQHKEQLLYSANNKTMCEAEINRGKVTRLLQKFVEQKIIEDVQGRGEAFRDSSRCLYTFSKGSAAPVSTFGASAPTVEDSQHAQMDRSGSINKIFPPPLKYATSLVKTALATISIPRPTCKRVPAL